VTYREFLYTIERKKFAPAFFFTGEEEFLKEEAIQKITSVMVEPSLLSFNRDVLYGDEIGGREIINRCATPPWLAERRLVILRNLHRLLREEDRVLLLNYLDNPVPTTILLLVSPKVDLTQKFYRSLQNKAKTIQFSPLEEREVSIWIRNRIKESGKRINLEALRLLQESIGNDLATLAGEITKLLNYTANRNSIVVEDVRAVFGGWKIKTIFDLSTSIGQRNLKLSLQILRELIEGGEDTFHILYFLIKRFLKLWKMKVLIEKGYGEDEIARTVKTSRFYLQKDLREVLRSSEESIFRRLELLYETELKLKSGKGTPEMLIELLVYNLCEVDETRE